MKKIISVVGARPNFMKVAPIHKELEKNYKESIKHYIVHTGQHYDYSMSDAFFVDLELPKPDYFLGVGGGSHSEQTAKIMVEFDKILDEVDPDMVIVVGDVNSTLACSISSVKKGYKVAHIEAGLRSWDRSMPEEINRMVTDSISDYFFITEKSGYQNLLNQNIEQERLFLVGNTMIDSLVFALGKINEQDVLNKYNIYSEFGIATLHRPSNVDDQTQFENLLEAIEFISSKSKLIFPIHPRTKLNIKKFGYWEELEANKNLIITEPLSYFEFLSLMKNSKFIVTDSGGIQEETTFLKIPCFTLRTSTERPITCEIGSNILLEPKSDLIISELNNFFNGKIKQGIIPELWDGATASRICKIIFKLLN